jgi:hypothetical protein
LERGGGEVAAGVEGEVVFGVEVRAALGGGGFLETRGGGGVADAGDGVAEGRALPVAPAFRLSFNAPPASVTSFDSCSAR